MLNMEIHKYLGWKLFGNMQIHRYLGTKLFRQSRPKNILQ